VNGRRKRESRGGGDKRSGKGKRDSITVLGKATIFMEMRGVTIRKVLRGKKSTFVGKKGKEGGPLNWN